MSRIERKPNLKWRFVSNTSWQLLQTIYSMLLSLIVGSLSARYLGPSNYGLIGYGASLVSLFSSVCKLGMDGVVINEIVKRKEKTGDYIGAVLVLRLISSIIAIVAIYVAVFIIEPGNRLLHVVTFLQSIAIILQVHEVFNYWFQAELLSKYYVIASVIGLTVMSAWRINLLRIGASVEWFALSSAVQALAVLIITGIVFVKMSHMRLRSHIADMKYLMSLGHHYIIATIAVTLYMHTDKIMIGKMLNEEFVGYYTAAMTIATLWEFVPGAIINSARPIILGDREHNYEGYIHKLQLLMLFMTVTGLVVGIGIVLLGGIAIHILYGEQYSNATPILSILIWSTCFAQIGTARSIWIVGEEKNAYQKYMVLMGAGLNIVLDYFFIQLWGLEGAAVATLISQIFVQFGAPMFFDEIKPFSKIYFNSFRLLKTFNWSELLNLLKRKGN